MKTPINHNKGTDQAVSLTIYYDGEPVDWSTYADTSTLTFHVHSLVGTSVKDVALTGGTFPTSATGAVSITLSDSDFSSNDLGEYVWYLAGTSLAAADGKTPPVTGDYCFDYGRFFLSAPDGDSVTHI